jgi:hypothetical protein
MDAQRILVELQTLRSGEPESTLRRLRELADEIEHAMLADRSVGAAQTHQAIDYLCDSKLNKTGLMSLAKTSRRSIAGSPWRSDEPRDGSGRDPMTRVLLTGTPANKGVP